MHAYPSPMRDSIAEKLHPNRVRVSGKFTAILAYLLDEEWTDPPIKHLTITSDGILLDSSSGFANEILGDIGDLRRNIIGVGEVAGLTPAETAWLLARGTHG
jgi:hypothetical protein